MLSIFRGTRVTEDLDECYPLRSDVEVPYSSKFRPRRRKRLTKDKFDEAFDGAGRLVDVESVLTAVQRGGCDPRIRPQVWEFLVGAFAPSSTAEERERLRRARRQIYANLKVECNLVDPVVGSGVVVDFPRVREDGHDVPLPANCDHPMLRMLEQQQQAADGAGAEPSRATLVPISGLAGADGSGDAKEQTEGQLFTETREEVVRREGFEKVRKWRLGLHQIGVDVMRADRTLLFYEDEGNRTRLMDVLALYSWWDSDVGYCQGMSDIMSPFVVLFDNNADAFWCFERLMRRMRKDFMSNDGELGVQTEIRRMGLLLKTIDPELYLHFEDIGVGQLLFTVRPMMAMFRRELSFADALYLWELQWSREYGTGQAEVAAQEDIRAVHSVEADPVKGNSRTAFFQEAAHYQRLRGREGSAHAGNEMHADGAPDDPTGGAATAKKESTFRSASVDFKDDEAQKAVSAAAAETLAGSATPPRSARTLRPGLARRLRNRWQVAAAKARATGGVEERNGPVAAPNPAAAVAQATAAAPPTSGQLHRSSTAVSRWRGAAAAGTKAGSAAPATRLAFRSRLPSMKPVREAASELSRMNVMELARPLNATIEEEGADGEEDEEGGPGAHQALRSRERLNTFCVLAVVLGARKDFLLGCREMDEVVDVFNQAACSWDLKLLAKEALQFREQAAVLGL